MPPGATGVSGPVLKPGPRGRLRATQWPMVLGLALLWMLLWGTVTLANVLTGLLIGVLVCLVFPLPRIETQVRLRPVGVARLVVRCALDMTVSSWRINRYILAPGPPACAVLRVRLRSPGDLLLTTTAICVSAVPGSTVLEVHRATGTLYLHVMGARHEAERERARREVLRLERRVVRAFGTREDIERAREAEREEAAEAARAHGEGEGSP